MDYKDYEKWWINKFLTLLLTLFSFIDVVLVASSSSLYRKNISTFLGCQWNWILQMNKALTPENEHQILQWMKSNFSPWGKKEKEKDDSIRFLSPTLTCILKMQTRLEVRNWLVAAGFPPRTKEQLKKKWEDLLSATKANHAKWKKTGVQ